MWSRSLSSASNSSARRRAVASPLESRLSIRCVSSPSRIAPAIRALPLNVCNVRCKACTVSRVARLRAPGAQLLAGLREEFGRFVEEDRQHLTVDVVMNFEQRGLDPAWASAQRLRATALACGGAATACSIGSAFRSTGVESAAGSPTAASSRLIVMPCSSASATRAATASLSSIPCCGTVPGAASPAR